MMDEGKHGHWGEGFPDITQYRELNYIYPAEMYRPLRRAQKARPSPYPLHELTSARSTLLRSVHNPGNRPKPGVSFSRMQSLLGIPSDASAIVMEHVNTGKSYHELEASQAVDAQTSNYEARQKVVNVVTDDEDDVVEILEEKPEKRMKAWNLEKVSELKIKTISYEPPPPGTEESIDLPIVIEEENDIFIRPVMETQEEGESSQESAVESRLMELKLVHVLKCDYCPFVCEIARGSNARDPQVQEPMMEHLTKQVHYCASSYFARKVGDKFQLTELENGALVKNPAAYMETVLVICPKCKFIFETIHQCAVHYRYQHKVFKGIYGLTDVLESRCIPDILGKECTTCGKIFFKAGDFSLHRKTEGHWPYKHQELDGSKINVFVPCPLIDECGDIFRSLNSLSSHFRNAHSDIVVAPFVNLKTYMGNANVIRMCTMPIPEKGQSVQLKNETEIEALDKMHLKQVVQFFYRMNGYPAKSVAKLFMNKFDDELVKGVYDQRGAKARLRKAREKAIAKNDKAKIYYINKALQRRTIHEKMQVKKKEQRKQLAKRASELQAVKRELDVLQQDSTKLETDSTKLETDSTKLETDSTKLETDSTKLETDSTKLETDSTKLETDSTKLETDSTKLEIKGKKKIPSRFFNTEQQASTSDSQNGGKSRRLTRNQRRMRSKKAKKRRERLEANGSTD